MKRMLSYFRFFREFGLGNSLQRVRNHYLVWRISPEDNSILGNTSITDEAEHNGYSVLCREAVDSDDTFAKFRSCVSIIDVLDHVTISQGNAYLRFIKSKNSLLLDKSALKILKSIDAIGRPLTWKLSSIGSISPTMVRYAKVYGDLERLFGPISNFKIAEVGIGFGGQTAVTSAFGGVKEFYLYDLPVVLNLAEKFLRTVGVKASLNLIDGRNPQSCVPDLFISNYAFSEISRDVQDRYLSNVILKSPRGYITWNNSAEEKLSGYSLAELVRIIPNSEILPEIPLTSTYNSIIVWGHRIASY